MGMSIGMSIVRSRCARAVAVRFLQLCVCALTLQEQEVLAIFVIASLHNCSLPCFRCYVLCEQRPTAQVGEGA